MDQLPSLNLDELMKLDGSLLEIDPCSDNGIPFIEGLASIDELLPLSPKSPIVAFDPIVSLPGMVPQPNSNAFHSSEGSGAANSEDPTFHIEEEDGEEEPVRPKRKPRGGRAAASGPPKDPKERIRAKNRRAQARYREKQKALRNGTSEILEQTTADLQRLRLENSQLLSRNQIMDNVLVVRDHSVGILEKSKEAEEKMSQPGSKLFSTADTVMKTRFQRLLPSAPGTCSRRPGTTTTTTAAGMKNGAVSIVEVKDNNDDEDHDGCNCPLANATVAEMIAAKATMNEIVQQRYRIYAERLSDALKEMEDPRSSSHAKVTAEESMTEVLWETGAMCFESAVLEPTVLQKLLVVSVVDDDTGSDVVKAAKWAGITAKLNLTDAQRQKMQPIREVFLQRAARIAAERKQLLMDLHIATSGATPATTTTAMSEEGEEEEATTTTTSLHSLQDVTTNWLGLHDKTQALEANLMEEHLACMELVAKCFGGILTPLQKSKAIVESYPAFPDIFAIATAAAVEHSALPAAPGASFSGAAGSEVNKVLAQ